MRSSGTQPPDPRGTEPLREPAGGHTRNSPVSSPGLSPRHSILWGLAIMAGAYLYVARGDVVRDGMLDLSSSSAILASGVYLVMGCVRGFTLIPVTYLIPFGLFFLTPVVHF